MFWFCNGVMERSSLGNRFLKIITNEEAKMTYNKQRNLCVTILCKTKIEFYASLDKVIVKGNTTSRKP